MGTRPVVVTIHDVSYARHPEWYPYKRDPLRRAFYRRSAVAADRIITDSAFSKAEIVAAYGVAARFDRRRAAGGIPDVHAGPSLPLPAACPPRFVLHVGDLHARRNLEMVARALQAVRARNRSVQDVSIWCSPGSIAARGAALEALIARAGGATPLVTFAGPVDEPTLLALYRSAAALVYPSRYEGFGLPLLEAMSCGVPVIAAPRRPSPKSTGDAAVLLDPDDEAAWADAIERMLR